MKVKRPPEPPEWHEPEWHEIQETKLQELQKIKEVQREQETKYVENKEEQEKEVVDSDAKTSEDVHGGSEITKSLQVIDSKTQDANMQESEESEKEEGEEGDIEDEGDDGEETEEEGGKRKGGEGGEEGGEEDRDHEECGEDYGDYGEDGEDEGYEENYEEVVDARKIVPMITKLKLEFYRTIDMIAEEETKLEDFSGYDKLSVNQLVKRALDRRSLKRCYTSRVRNSVVLILDTSGSMEWWAQLLQQLSAIAKRRKDVTVIYAPNGGAGYEDEECEQMFQELQKGSNRTIIYVGDFDGANTPIELSWKHKVYWICPENRYYYFTSHDWVDFDESDFKGMFFRCFDEQALLRALIKMRRWHRGFYDYHRDYEGYSDL